MYTILVADDEEIERDAIKHIINASCPRIGLVMEAANGLEAVDRYRDARPDIVFCDIKMPGKDGLEAVADIKRMNPEQCAVIVTAFDYFNYAREALSLGVDDYLLKPAADATVVALVDRLVARLDARDSSRKDREEKDRRLELLTGFFRNAYLSALLDPATDEASLDGYARVLPTDSGECIVAAVTLDLSAFPVSLTDPGQAALLRDRARSIIKDEFEYRLFSFMVHERDGRIYFALFPRADFSGQYASPAAIHDLFSSVAGRIRERLSARLVTALALAETNGVAMRRALRSVDRALADRALASRDATDGDATDGGDCADVFLCGGLADESPPCDERSPALPCDRRSLTPRIAELMRLVERRIEDEYMTAISLDTAAKSAGLSSFYFSKAFRQWKGMTFIDTLNEVRVRKARELLANPVLSVKEIAARTGYSDPNYFARVFKSAYGATPTEYRNKILR